VEYAVDQFGENRAVPMMRSRVAWFTKGLPHSSRLRERLSRLQTKEEVLEVVQAFFEPLVR
jgi:tRNA-dihydrouridine synthase